MRILLVAAGVLFVVMGVVFIRGMANPARLRKKMFEGWTGMPYDKSLASREPESPARAVMAGVFAIVFFILGILFFVGAIEYIAPEEGAASKARMERHFRESTEKHLRESNEAFSRMVKEGFPVEPKPDQEAPER